MNRGDRLKVQSALNTTLQLAMTVWRKHNLAEARQIAEKLISMQLGQLDLKEAESRSYLLRIAALLSESGAGEAVMEICLILREQQKNVSVQNQIAIASLLNRVCLMVRPMTHKDTTLAA